MSIKKRIPYHTFNKEISIRTTCTIDNSIIFREYFQERQLSTDDQSNSDFDFSEFSKKFNKKNKLSKRRIKIISKIPDHKEAETQRGWKRLEILTPRELEIGQHRSKRLEFSKEDIESFKL